MSRLIIDTEAKVKPQTRVQYICYVIKNINQ